MPEPQPNGLDNTEMNFMKLTNNHFGLLQIEVVPVVVTKLGDDGADQERFYTLEMQLVQIKTDNQVSITVMVPEDYRDQLVDTIKVEHFPNQPCTHGHEGHHD